MNGKMKLFAMVVVFLVAGAFAFALQNKPANLPPGVAPAMWVSLTDNSGIVLRDSKTMPVPRGKPVIHGIFMVKLGEAWQTMSLDSVPEILPVGH